MEISFYEAMLADSTPAADDLHTVLWQTDGEPDRYVTVSAYQAFMSDLGQKVGNALNEDMFIGEQTDAN